MNKAVCRIALLAGALVLFTSFAWGQGSRTQIWPELDVYYKLNDQFRMRFLASITKSGEFTNATDGILQLDVDFSIKPVSMMRRLVLHQEPDKLISFRVGYAYVPSFADEDPTRENRLFLEPTVRTNLFRYVLLSDRSRIEGRWIDGETSARYRNRIRAEGEVPFGGFRFSSYVSAEWYYDSRSSSWSRNEYSVGAEFPFIRRSILEIYYAHQANKSPGLQDVNAIGTTLQIYVGKNRD